jgi:hypothetical protein
MTNERISQRRLEVLSLEVTTKDRELIAILAMLHLATGNQLTRAVWPGATPAQSRSARRTLKRLVQWRVLARLERRQGGLGRGSDSYTYALDVVGQRLLRLDGGSRRPHLPRPAMWRHALMVAETYVRVRESLTGTDRHLTEWQGEPDCWRDFAGAYGDRVVLKPDGFLKITGPRYEDLFFLEVDTGSQSRNVIRAKILAYRRHASAGVEQLRHDGVYPQIVFVTSTPTRLSAIVDLFGELPAEAWRMFAVGLVDDVARLFGDPVTSP